MKKIIAILLVLVLALSCVACDSSDNATKIKKDYQSFDWENSIESQKVLKANELIMRIDKLPSAEKQELSEIKTELERISKGGSLTPEVSPSPILPDVSPNVTPNVSPQTM